MAYIPHMRAFTDKYMYSVHAEYAAVKIRKVQFAGYLYMAVHMSRKSWHKGFVKLLEVVLKDHHTHGR